MNQELTDKNYCIILMGGYKTYVNKNDFDAFKRALNKGVKFIEIGDSLINTTSVVCATLASDIQNADREKRGDWKCEYGYWHIKGQECGHAEMHKIINFKPL